MGEANRSADTPLFQIDTHSGIPPYRQVHEAVVRALATGRLQPGAKLPTVRSLATQLALATGTVASAYRALEADGIVEGRGRAGTFVRLGKDPIQAQARQVAMETVERLRAIGIPREHALALIGDAYAVTTDH